MKEEERKRKRNCKIFYKHSGRWKLRERRCTIVVTNDSYLGFQILNKGKILFSVLQKTQDSETRDSDEYEKHKVVKQWRGFYRIENSNTFVRTTRRMHPESSTYLKKRSVWL